MCDVCTLQCAPLAARLFAVRLRPTDVHMSGAPNSCAMPAVLCAKFQIPRTLVRTQANEKPSWQAAWACFPSQKVIKGDSDPVATQNVRSTALNTHQKRKNVEPTARHTRASTNISRVAERQQLFLFCFVFQYFAHTFQLLVRVRHSNEMPGLSHKRVRSTGITRSKKRTSSARRRCYSAQRLVSIGTRRHAPRKLSGGSNKRDPTDRKRAAAQLLKNIDLAHKQNDPSMFKTNMQELLRLLYDEFHHLKPSDVEKLKCAFLDNICPVVRVHKAATVDEKLTQLFRVPLDTRKALFAPSSKFSLATFGSKLLFDKTPSTRAVKSGAIGSAVGYALLAAMSAQSNLIDEPSANLALAATIGLIGIPVGGTIGWKVGDTQNKFRESNVAKESRLQRAVNSVLCSQELITKMR
jgi:hypothetical protein